MTLNEQARTAIIEQMEAQGLNKVQLAERMDVTKGYVTNLLRPGRNMTMNAVDKVAGVLGVTPVLSLEGDVEAFVPSDPATSSGNVA